MSYANYQKALRLGKKEQQRLSALGETPYVNVLEDALGGATIDSEVSLGVMQIPLKQVVGTYTRGRSSSFARNFMPLLEPYTEFGTKWIHLCESHVETGIHDPIRCYEYMNHYYVVEGNKRVSVLKFFDAVSVDAEVTRIVPEYQEDDPSIRLYYEFMDFYQITGIHYLWLTREGAYPWFLRSLHRTQAEDWTLAFRKEFFFQFSRFEKLYEKEFHFENLSIGDAFFQYLQAFQYEAMEGKSDDTLSGEIRKLQKELIHLNEHDAEPSGVFHPEDADKEGRRPRIARTPVTVGFVFDFENTNASLAHEEARLYVEEKLKGQIRTVKLDGALEDRAKATSRIEELIDREKPQILFFASPLLRPVAFSTAVQHPQTKVLLCDINNNKSSIRSYFGLMYEAKFVEGVIAGALTQSGHIGYAADFPNAGMLACINAFAIGAATTRSDAKVHVTWAGDASTFPPEVDLVEKQYGHPTPGLYFRDKEEDGDEIAKTYWDWKLFYEKMISGVLKGSWKKDNPDQTRSVSYWWGLSSGVIRIDLSDALPYGLKRLAGYVKDGVSGWELDPFGGRIVDQAGTVRSEDGSLL